MMQQPWASVEPRGLERLHARVAKMATSSPEEASSSLVLVETLLVLRDMGVHGTQTVRGIQQAAQGEQGVRPCITSLGWSSQLGPLFVFKGGGPVGAGISDGG